MTMRAARFLTALAFSLMTMALPATAQEQRSVVTTQDGDYFGFDLRTERDVTLERCSAVCLADGDCRAFTYNTRAQWCFLKSDYSVLKTFAGAVAGKVVTDSGEPDLGAPPELDYVPAHMRDEARRYREELARVEPLEHVGIVHLSSTAAGALGGGDPRAAVESYRAALAIEPGDVPLWLALARAQFQIAPQNGSERSQIRRDGTSAALGAYGLARTTALRAQALASVGLALDRNDLYRPSRQAYEASLALVDDEAVRAAYDDLRTRRGFRSSATPSILTSRRRASASPSPRT